MCLQIVCDQERYFSMSLFERSTSVVNVQKKSSAVGIILQDENCLFPERYLNGVKKEKSTNHSKTSISMKKILRKTFSRLNHK